MTLPRERVLTCLQHQEPDLVPYYIWFDDVQLPRFLAHYGVERKEDFCCDHIVRILNYPLSDWVDEHHFRDEYGTLWLESEIPHVVEVALPEPKLGAYMMPDAGTPDHFADVGDFLDHHPDQYRMIHVQNRLLCACTALRGYEAFMMDMAAEPHFVLDMMEMLEGALLQLVDALIAAHGDKIDALGPTDDYGGQSRMLISPRMWRKYFKPTLAKLGERLRAANITYFLHCCGHLEPIIPDLIEIGVEILHPVQPEAMEISKLKREYGQYLTFMGGISTQRLLPFGTPEEVRRVTKATMALMGENGGYICAPAKPIMRDVPFENGLALVETLIHQ